MGRILVLLLAAGCWASAPGADPLRAQAPGPSPAPTAAYPAGLTLAYGVGAYGLKDRAISGERYEGTLPYLGVSWARDHGRYFYRVGMGFRRSDDIRNHSVSTTITRFALNQAFLYPVGTTPVLGRDARLFLGPTTGAFVFVNEQHLAVNALGFSQSVAALLSLGVRADAVVPISRRLSVLGSFRTPVLSLGIRAVDDETDDASPARLLLLPAGMNAAFHAGAAWSVGRLSVGVGYLFQLGRIDAWTPMLDASDSVVGSVSWRF